MEDAGLKTIRARLTEMSRNLWWTWNAAIIEIFRDIDPDLWRDSNHNPIKFLAQLDDDTLSRRIESQSLVSRINFAFRRQEEYLTSPYSYGKKHGGPLWRHPVAYFCAEFGLHESLPIYSGGLGVLAGDHLKSASDLGMPLVAVGLFYSHGYFTQQIDEHGWQKEIYGSSQIESLPLTEVTDADGRPLRISVKTALEDIDLRIWRLDVGRIRLFLLDSDIDSNDEEDRELTRNLYGGGHGMRIRQEIILGIGGYRALRAMGIDPGVMHLNEGHCAFAPLEAIRVRMQEQGEDYETARKNVTLRTAFTTHTPVPAGHDRFDEQLVRENLGWLADELGIDFGRFMELGRIEPANSGESFA